jgi:hypothetical protein
LQELSFEQFAKQIKDTQDAYVQAKQANDVDAMRRALFQASLLHSQLACSSCRLPAADCLDLHLQPSCSSLPHCALSRLARYPALQVDETQVFWALPTSSVQRVDYEHLDHEPLAVMLNAMPSGEPMVQASHRQREERVGWGMLKPGSSALCAMGPPKVVDKSLASSTAGNAAHQQQKSQTSLLPPFLVLTLSAVTSVPPPSPVSLRP